MEQSDEQLIDAYRKGNEAALVILIERHFAGIYSYVYRFVHNTSAAEDIVQETFIKVWRQLGRFKGGSGLRPWLFRIARNTAIDHLRKKKNIPFSYFSEEGEADAVFEDESIDIIEIAIARERKENLNTAIEQLPVVYREILILRAEDDLTFEEISGVTGKPLNTVKSLYRRGIALLQKAIATTGSNAPKNPRLS
ncbi:MAG: subunit sigma-24 of polymerase [Candidatus Nomurabacteria bacterium]|nr:subunit sigma-24 of polymerase [Candidatus Nomurabacteria bacterium]